MSDQRDAGKCSAVELVTVTLPPPPGRRVPRRNCNTGEGGVGAQETSRDMETGQVASRAVPVPGPMVEQGARAAMVE